MDGEKIVHDVAERVREIVGEAERTAAKIVSDAEADAKRIRADAERQGRERLAEIRSALEELQGKLGGTAAPAPDDHGGAAATSAEVDPGPVTVPEPEPVPVPEPEPPPGEPLVPPPAPEPEPAIVPEPEPPPGEADPPAADNGVPDAAAKSGDAAGARLVAMNMALDGASREQIEGHLAEHYALEDSGAIVDDVLELARK